jgi:hypothetical protein
LAARVVAALKAAAATLREIAWTFYVEPPGC